MRLTVAPAGGGLALAQHPYVLVSPPLRLAPRFQFHPGQGDDHRADEIGRGDGLAVLGDGQVGLLAGGIEPEPRFGQVWIAEMGAAVQPVGGEHQPPAGRQRQRQPRQPARPGGQRHMREERQRQHRIVGARRREQFRAGGRADGAHADLLAQEIDRRGMDVAGGQVERVGAHQMAGDAAIAGGEFQHAAAAVGRPEQIEKAPRRRRTVGEVIGDRRFRRAEAGMAEHEIPDMVPGMDGGRHAEHGWQRFHQRVLRTPRYTSSVACCMAATV